MKINRHNLTIVTHCASKDLQGYITKGLQFTKTGTMAVNGAYSVAVSALHTDPKEPVPLCITRAEAGELLKDIGEEGQVKLAGLRFIDGTPAQIKWPEKPPVFEIYLNVDYLLKLAQSVCEFSDPRNPTEDAVVRIQFTGQAEPVRMDARNISGQKWEALLMPRKPGTDDARFAVPPPPPPVEEDEFAAAMRLAESL